MPAHFRPLFGAQVVVTTASLPGGPTGSPYSQQVNAVGGTPPYTWAIVGGALPTGLSISSTGLISGTPTVAGPFTFTVQAQDQNGLCGAKSFTVSMGQLAGPQAIWPGYTDSVSVDFGLWSPVTGSVDHFNIYKNGALLYGTLQPRSQNTNSVIPDGHQGQPGHPLAWYTDVGLTAGVSNNYTATWVDALGNESAQSSPLTLTTRSNVPSVAPTPPATWQSWFVSPPTTIVPANGGTLWLATNTTADPSGSVAGSTSQTGAFFTCTGCSVAHALLNANIAGGDVIVYTAGATYTVQVGGYQVPAFTGANGFTFIISSNELTYNPSASPALPTYKYDGSPKRYHLTATGTIAAAATTATLSPNQSVTLFGVTTAATDASGNWLLKTGYYVVSFRVGNVDGDERTVLFTHGSASINWTALNGGYTTPGLTNTSSADLVVWYSNGVTPFDIPAMPTLNFGTSFQACFSLAQGCKKVWFLGLNAQPPNGITGGPGQVVAAFLSPNSSFGSTVTPCDSIYIDRCIIGTDVTVSNFSYLLHGVNATINHFMTRGCYYWGILANIAGSGGDSNALVLRGQFHALLDNYMASITETVIWGGVFIDQTQIPQDIVIYGNVFHKPRMWLTMRINGVSTSFNNIKNHVEVKCAQRLDAQFNSLVNCWVDGQAGYHGTAFSINCRDQTIPNSASTDAQTNPWNIVSDINIQNNQSDNCACFLQIFSADGTTGFTTRTRVTNNRAWISTINPAADRMQAVRLGPGPVTNFILTKNSFIVNNTLPTTGVGAAYGIYFPIFGGGSGGYLNPQPYTKNGWSTFQDGMTLKDNILDSGVGSNQAYFYDAGLAGFAGQLNMAYGPNLTISDPATTYPATTFAGVAYTAIGMANFTANTCMPLNVSDWNVTSGQFATASSTGGPMGYFFSTAQPVAKNWNPGQYCQIPLGTTGSTTSAQRQSSFYVPDLTTVPKLKGYCLRPHYKAIEGTYNDLVNNPATCAFVTNFIGDLNWAAANNKQIVFKIEDYSTSNNDVASVFPTYFFTTSDPHFPGTPGIPVTYSANPGGSSGVTRLCYWNTGCVNRLNTVLTYLMQSLPLTVNGVNYTGLDNVPCVEGIILGEEWFATASGQGTTSAFTGLPGYSDAAWTAGIENAFASLAAACIKTNAIAPFNLGTYTGRGPTAHTYADFSAMGQSIVNAVGAVGGPDVLPNQSNTVAGAPNNPYVGTDADVWYQGEIAGTPNFIGQIPRMMEVQQPDYLGPGTTPAIITQLYNYVNSNNRCSHVFWARVSTGDSADWTNLAPFLQANPLSNTAYPALYPPKPSSATQIFNFPSFNGSNTLLTTSATASGNLVVVGSNSGLSGSSINIFNGGGHSGGKAWYGNQVDVHLGFTTDFLMTPPQPGQMTFTAPNTTNGAIGIIFAVQTSNSTTDPSPTPTYGVQAGGDANLAGFGAFWWPSSPLQSAICNSVAICFHLESQNSIQWVPLSGGAQANPNSIALYVSAGPSDAFQPCQDLNPSGINFYNGNPLAVHIVYDGSLITMTMKDTVTGNQLRTSWPFVVQNVIGGNSGWVGFAGGKAEKNGVVSTAACTWLINNWSFSQGFNQRLATPTFSVPAGQYATSQSVTISGPPGATIYYSTNGQQPTTSSTPYSGPITVSASTLLQAVAVESGFTDSLVASANYLIQASGPTINFPTTFASAGNLLSLVGTASIQGSAVQLILSQASQPNISGYVGCAWYVSPVNVDKFTTTFTFQYPSGGNNLQAGLTFCIQNQPPANDPGYIYTNQPASSTDGMLRWSGGGPLMMSNGNGFGYSGFNSASRGSPPSAQVSGPSRSVAIKFDAGNNATGLYQSAADVQVNTGGTATGLNFVSGAHQFQVAVTYDGTTLSWTIKDLNTSTTKGPFTSVVNIPSVVGSSVAYVGFTAGSFFGTQVEILNWTF